MFGIRGSGEHTSHWQHWLVTYLETFAVAAIIFLAIACFALADVPALYAEAIAWVTGGGNPPAPQKPPSFANAIAPAGRTADFLDICQTFEQSPANREQSDNLVPSIVNEGIRIRLKGSMLWPSGTAELRPEAMPSLDEVIQLLHRMPNRIRVEGHTDDIPLRSSRFASNLELSQARAEAVARYLIEAGHIPAERISVVGYGDSRPIVPNDTAEHRSLNRRADIVVLYGTSP